LRGQLDPACLSGADPFRHRQSPVSWSPVKKSLRRSNRDLIIRDNHPAMMSRYGFGAHWTPAHTNRSVSVSSR
jgi:hypothetical protein